MSLVCRTCLEEITDFNFLSLNDTSNKVRDELAACIPELDLTLVPQAAVCVYCARAIHSAYDFKQKCLQTEETIRSHMQDTKLLDLEQIKKKTESDSKFDVVHGLGIGMEVIYIRDEDMTDEGANEGEVITGDNSQSEMIRAEPVNLFLNMNQDVNSQALMDGFNSDTESVGFRSKTPHKKTQSHAKKKTKAICNGKDSASKSFNCNLCSFSTMRSFNLKQHLQAHKNSKRRANLHMTKYNGSKYLQCNHCKFTTSSKVTLKVHSETHKTKRYSCSNCEYQTEYRVALFNHVKTHDVIPPGRKSIKPVETKSTVQPHSSSKNLNCSDCDYESTNVLSSKRRAASHSFKCTICNYDCLSRISLESHMNKHGGNKSLKCTLCNYSSPSKYKVTLHMLSHTGEKPFECTLCNYRANQKVHIERHMKFHLSKGAWKCDQCSYSINSRYYLEKHKEVHENRTTK